MIEDKGCCYFVVYPIVNRVGSRRPAKCVCDSVLDLRDAAEPVLKHSFKPFWVQRLSARLELDRLFKRPDLSVRRQRIRQINRGSCTRLLLSGARHASQILEVMIYVDDADFGAVDVLVCDLYTRESALEQGLGLATLEALSARISAVCKALARDEQFPELATVVPLAVVHHEVDGCSVVPPGVRDNAKYRFLVIIPRLRHLDANVFSDKVLLVALVEAGDASHRCIQQFHCSSEQVAENSRDGHHYIDSRSSELFKRDDFDSGRPIQRVAFRPHTKQPERLCN